MTIASFSSSAVAMTGARCHGCRKGLIWTVAGKVVRHKRRVYWRLRRSDASRLAIRCVWCLAVYCPRCARKHFEPRHVLVHRTAAQIDRLVAAVVKGIGPKAVRCAVAGGKKAAP